MRTRVFKVDPGEGEQALKVPLWFWNSAEWCSFTQASAKAQRPALMHALRFVRDGVLLELEAAVRGRCNVLHGIAVHDAEGRAQSLMARHDARQRAA